MSCLYILEIKPLLVALFAGIFSQSVECLFILTMVPKILLILNEVQVINLFFLLQYLFYCIPFIAISMKLLFNPKLQRFSPQKVVVFCFKLRPMIHFELTLIHTSYHIWKLIFKHMDIQLFEQHLLNQLSLSLALIVDFILFCRCIFLALCKCVTILFTVVLL